MHREAVVACVPYLAGMAVLLICQACLIRLSGARLQMRRLADLHRDQSGAVQSLSFILTLPAFVTW